MIESSDGSYVARHHHHHDHWKGHPATSERMTVGKYCDISSAASVLASLAADERTSEASTRSHSFMLRPTSATAIYMPLPHSFLFRDHHPGCGVGSGSLPGSTKEYICEILQYDIHPDDDDDDASPNRSITILVITVVDRRHLPSFASGEW